MGTRRMCLKGSGRARGEDGGKEKMGGKTTGEGKGK